MIFSVLTLFPDLIHRIVSYSILGRALDNACFQLDVVNIRDFAVNTYGKVDDQIYGGGTGMLMMAEPLWQATESQRQEHADLPSEVIYLSPRGQKLDQALVEDLSEKDHLIFVCGHYEGIDERYLEKSGAREVSIGDYVLSGGELPALVLIDAIARRLPGVLPKTEAFENESLSHGLLAEPQYTRPAVWKDLAVPDVLLSGHAAKIESWRQAKQIELTLSRRPDLGGLLSLARADWIAAIEQIKADRGAADSDGKSD